MIFFKIQKTFFYSFLSCNYSLKIEFTSSLLIFMHIAYFFLLYTHISIQCVEMKKKLFLFQLNTRFLRGLSVYVKIELLKRFRFVFLPLFDWNMFYEIKNKRKSNPENITLMSRKIVFTHHVFLIFGKKHRNICNIVHFIASPFCIITNYRNYIIYSMFFTDLREYINTIPIYFYR